MPSGEGEIKLILGFLEKRYPKGYDSFESLRSQIPPIINADKLLENLIYCYEQRYLNTSPIEEEEKGIVDFYDIKISAFGIRYLRGLE